VLEELDNEGVILALDIDALPAILDRLLIYLESRSNWC
jgi:hypothetical protein